MTIFKSFLNKIRPQAVIFGVAVLCFGVYHHFPCSHIYLPPSFFYVGWSTNHAMLDYKPNYFSILIQ